MAIKRIHLFFFSLAIFAAAAAAHAADQDQAQAIAQKIYDRDDGRDSWALIEMTLIDDAGSEKVRKLQSGAKDFGELSKRFIRFTEPRAIEGTSFLALERHEEDDVQFLYLPAVRRARRIAAGQKDRSFVNTDFTYEDMERRKVERDTYVLQGSEKVLANDCWILERSAKDADDSQYGKVRIWADKKTFLVLKSEMYSKKGKLAKQLEVREVKTIDTIPTAMLVSMHDLAEDHRTLMRVLEMKYNKGVADEVFTEAYLERAG